ncbi:MAG: DUF6470 family protein [Clostridia bacterium]
MLQISQTHAQIGIETQKAQLYMQSLPAKLNMHQEYAKIEIELDLPKVHIDQYQCFAEAGRKNNRDLLKETVQLASQQAMQYIAKTAADGKTLQAVQDGGNAIAEIAARGAGSQKKEFGMVTIPKSRPKIEVTGDVKLYYRSGGVQYSYQSGEMKIQATPSEINIYMKQYTSIQFKYVGKNVDIEI